ncbi:hypothetical protein F4802DRAFT_597189 [Xylaria palmicola]|nr:hypothetical protein F4802DRAFT_597189 [Xylaria palmicola]
MSISIRRSIRWLPDAASEPTSTIVLTSPERRFVDIRVLKAAPEQSTASLDWAFAGISFSEMRHGVRHAAWRHVVDSRTPTPGAVVDEGDIFPQHDGTTLETGRMVNPATGDLTEYEEVWTDLEAEGILPASPNQGALTGRPTARCVVLELEDGHREARGFAICLGRYYQGVARVGHDFAAERWLWTEGEWRPEYRVGHLRIPRSTLLDNPSLSGGDEVGSEDTCQRWRVAEVARL